MKCPICGKNVELRNKQVGIDEQGNPVFNQYAVCKDCKKQWNLDKKRTPKTTAKPADETADSQTPAKKAAPAKQNPTKKAPVKQDPAKKVVRKPVAKPDAETADSQTPAKKAAPAKQNPTKKAPVKQDSAKKVVRKPAAKPATETADSQTQAKKAAPAKKAVKSNVSKKETRDNKSIKKNFDDTIILEKDEQKLGNIPSEKVRSKKEQRVKQGYAEMLAADPKNTDHKNSKAKKQPVRKEEAFEDNYNEYEPIVRFRALRVIFGIISILIAAFYAFNSYSSGLLASDTGVTFLILAGCMGIAGLLLIILNATNNIFAFLLPMILYLASGLYAFLNRGDDTFLLYSAIIGAAFSVLFIILAISSRGDEEDYENFDDEDDDDDDDWDDEEEIDDDDDDWDDEDEDWDDEEDF